MVLSIVEWRGGRAIVVAALENNYQDLHVLYFPIDLDVVVVVQDKKEIRYIQAIDYWRGFYNIFAYSSFSSFTPLSGPRSAVSTHTHVQKR